MNPTTRNTLFFAFILLCSSTSMAQVKLGIRAGGNLNTMRFDFDENYGDEPHTKLKAGFHAGIVADIILVPKLLSLQPSLLFNNKGYSFDFEKSLQNQYDNLGLDVDIDNFEGYVRLNYNYIELPMNVVLKTDRLRFMAGPYVAVGIGGSFSHDFSFELDGEEIDGSDIYEKGSYDLKPVFGTVDDDDFQDFVEDDDVIELFRAFDYGVNAGIGYQFLNVLFSVNYSIGLSNLVPNYDTRWATFDSEYDENVVQNNRVITGSVTVFFK